MSENIEEQTRLSPERLGWRCPDSWLDFETTEKLGACQEIFGQPRAVAALRLALRLRSRGYNVYAAGPSGTGRTRTVRRVLHQESGRGPVPDDLCYVMDFDDPRVPRLLRLPAGRGRRLREALVTAADRFRQGVAALRASGEHRRRRESVAKGHLEEQSTLLGEFQKEVQAEGFALVEANLGPYRRHELAPMVEGQPVPFHELPSLVREGKLPEEEAVRLRERHPDLAARLAQTATKYRELSHSLERSLADADRDAARPLVDEVLAEIRNVLDLPRGERPGLDRFLNQLSEYLIGVFPLSFAAGEHVVPESDGGDARLPDPLEALRVNVIVDRTGQEGLPIIEEANPTPARLFGFVEIQRGPDGDVRADLGGIHAGALHQADGGFLLLNAHDLVQTEGAWAGLRRALRSGRLSVMGGSPEGTAPLVPEPAPLDVTVILVGTPGLREVIAGEDDEFNKLFKIVSLFEERVPLTRDTVSSFVCFLAHVVQEEKLLHLEAKPVARMFEAMVRLAGGRGKMATHLRLFTDLAREASLVAGEENAPVVTLEHMERTLQARRARTGVLSTRVLESIADGVLHVETEGQVVGQINALAVVETSLERLGYPVRVTATTAVGRAGIIDIEREAELSGEIYTKASMILGGYLRSRFAQRHPLAITASVCFEQSYGGVEGDSASCAELAALLSALARVPIRQDLAVTGAVDQHGRVLAVGGINEKIEGFWRVCRRRGLSGTQGVLIPATSVESLQLLPEVVEDVEAGRFSVYGASRVEEVVDLLMGIPLGEPGEDGLWPEGCLGSTIALRLEEMANIVREFGPHY